MSRSVDRVSQGWPRAGPRGNRPIDPDDVVLDDGVGPGVHTAPVRGILHRQDGKAVASVSARPVFAKDGRWWPSVILAAEALERHRGTVYNAVRRRRVCGGLELSFKPWPGVVYAGR